MQPINDFFDPASGWSSPFTGPSLNMNDVGQLAMLARQNGVSHAIRAKLPSDGPFFSQIEIISDLSASDIRPRDINKYGVITGRYVNAAGQLRAFVESDASDAGGFSDIGDLGGSLSWGTAINKSGQVTGVAMTPGEFEHAFRYTPPGPMEDLGNLTRKQWVAFPSEGRAINAGGQVVGQAFDDKTINGSSRFRAFLHTPGVGIEDLGALGDGNFSSANDINDDGWVVGNSEVTSNRKGLGGFFPGEFHVFVWTEEFGMARLEELVIDMPAGFDGRLERAVAINSSGQIAGNALWADGRTEAFLATPVTTLSAAMAVPEPSSALLGLVCAALLVLVRSRGRE